MSFQGDLNGVSRITTSSAPTLSSISVGATGSNGIVVEGISLKNLNGEQWRLMLSRLTSREFLQQAILLPFIGLIFFMRIWGARSNRKLVDGWFSIWYRLLKDEFEHVGADVIKAMPVNKRPKSQDDSFKNEREFIAKGLIQYIGPAQFACYAAGRNNVVFMDMQISTLKRFSPFAILGEYLLAIMFDGFSVVGDSLEANILCHEGKLANDLYTNKGFPGDSSAPYDEFVWALVHRTRVKRLMEDYYDLSLASAKTLPKLPPWTLVLTESKEISGALINDTLIRAVEQAGDQFVALIVSDQPKKQPIRVDEVTVGYRRITLILALEKDCTKTSSLFAYTLRLPDMLANLAHFRPDVMRSIRQKRMDEWRRLLKLDELDRLRERKSEQDKGIKQRRDEALKKLSANEQRKILEREKERNLRKMRKKLIVGR